MNEVAGKQRKGINVLWDKSKIKGDANVWVRGPKVGWKLVKPDTKNDGAALVTFPAEFTGARQSMVTGTEGGLTDGHFKVT